MSEADWTTDELAACRETGYALLAEGKLGLARNIFAGLVAIDPADRYARLALGLAHHRLGNLVEARRELEFLLAEDPENWRAALQLAEIHLKGKEGKEAEARAFEAERLCRAPDCPESVRGRARRLMRVTSGSLVQ